MEPLAPDSYGQFLAELKSRIQAAQLRASLAVNRELVVLYWQIGRDILDRQEREKWGAKVIDRLATDLKRSFPDMKGFSPRNLKYMRAFAEAWPEEPIVQVVLAQITWYHNVAILEKLTTSEDRIWCKGGNSAWLEPQCARAPNRSWTDAPARQGGCEFRSHASFATVRPRTGHYERPLQFRFPHVGRRCP